MKALYENLIDILDRECESYGRVLQIVESEREALTEHRTEALPELVGAKESVILNIRNLEEERQLVTLRIARHLDIPHEELRTSHVMEHADPATATRLRTTRDNLLQCMDHIGRINQINRRLCENGMALVRDVMGAVAHAAVGSPPGQKGYPATSGNQAHGTGQPVGTRSWQA